MIHIIDPRTQVPMPDLWLDGRRPKLPVRYMNDRNLFCAELVAIRQPTGLYAVIKSRYTPVPRRLVRRKTLQRYIDQVLEERS